MQVLLISILFGCALALLGPKGERITSLIDDSIRGELDGRDEHESGPKRVVDAHRRGFRIRDRAEMSGELEAALVRFLDRFGTFRRRQFPRRRRVTRAFSSEVGTGSREENASKQETRASVPIQSGRKRL